MNYQSILSEVFTLWVNHKQPQNGLLFQYFFKTGEHFAVFRNTNGVVRVLDAYCPHLGADMAAGGRVVNEDCLQCPFHGWTFSGSTGKCVDIPYTKKGIELNPRHIQYTLIINIDIFFSIGFCIGENL